MPSFADDTFDALITDPPYASGAMSTAARSAKPSDKYPTSKAFADFFGDCKDQRSWMRWTLGWLNEAYRVCKDQAFIGLFIDWRQLPALSDCLQWSEWIWRGVVPWDKRHCRPQKGRFRQQCEFFVWGTKGKVKQQDKYLPGLYSCQVPQSTSRHHMTEKPLQLMQDLLQITEEGSLILDPFAGGGTTAVAAHTTGRKCVCIEKSKEIAEIAKKRFEALS